MRAASVFVVGCLLLVLPACKSKAKSANAPKPTIIGRWQREGADTGYEFRNDGTVLVFAPPRSGEGKYRLDGETTIVILYPNGTESSRMEILSLTIDELEMNFEKYGRIKYRRAR